MTLDNSKNIFLEAAFFEATNIAKTGRKKNIISDSRYRFERNIDLAGVKKALNFAANLILEICGGEISKIIQAGSDESQNHEINISVNKINNVLNSDISIKEITDILENLKFGVKPINKDNLLIGIPSFRSDVRIEEDVIEEIIRIYGYNNIISKPINTQKYQLTNSSTETNLNNLRQEMCDFGLSEIISWSFIDSNLAQYFTKINPNLLISNAISEEMNYMRPSLLIGLLQTIKKNQSRGFFDLSLFEIGRIFNDIDINSQFNAISAIRIGKNNPRNHYKSDRNFDVMDIKSDAINALEILGVNFKSVQITTSDLPNFWHPYKSCSLKLGKNIIGYFGEIHPLISKKFSIKNKVNAFELFIDKLPKKINKIKKKPFIKSDFQIVNRDFAFIVDKEVKVSDITKLTKSVNQELISKVSIFDIYEGEKIDKDKKSIAFNVEITPKLATLESADIDEISNNIINIICNKLKGILRDS